jgi:hypothetical protein
MKFKHNSKTGMEYLCPATQFQYPISAASDAHVSEIQNGTTGTSHTWVPHRVRAERKVPIHIKKKKPLIIQS